MTPCVVIIPMAAKPNWPFWPNHRLPSGPTAMPVGALNHTGIGYSVTMPDVVMRPIFPSPNSVNHSVPSGPATIHQGSPAAAYSVMEPAVVIRPILSTAIWVNQSAPSGPTVMAYGSLNWVGTG